MQDTPSEVWQQARRVLVVEQIQDPGKLGTLLRTAVVQGWEAVFLLPGCCDPFDVMALRAAHGATLQVCGLRVNGTCCWRA